MPEYVWFAAVMLVAGGWLLTDHLRTVREKRRWRRHGLLTTLEDRG